MGQIPTYAIWGALSVVCLIIGLTLGNWTAGVNWMDGAAVAPGVGMVLFAIVGLRGWLNSRK